MVGGGKVEMEVLVVALSDRMKRWAIGGRRSHPFVSVSASRWEATTGRSASAVCNRVVMLVRMPMRPRWSCGAGLGGMGILTSAQCCNQTHARLSAQRVSGAAIIRGYLTETAWRNSKILSQSSAMVVNVLA